MARYSDDDPDALSVIGTPQCQSVAKSTGERCRMPAMSYQTCCRLHGGKIKRNLEAAERKRAEHEKRRFLQESGFYDFSAPAIEDPVTEFASHVGRVMHQNRFLGDQINNSTDCLCCGRVEFDPTILRELRNTSKELGVLLDSMIKHRIFNRALDIEEAKYAAVYKGLEMVLYKILGDRYNDSHIRAAERIFQETVDPLLKQIEA